MSSVVLRFILSQDGCDQLDILLANLLAHKRVQSLAHLGLVLNIGVLALLTRLLVYLADALVIGSERIGLERYDVVVVVGFSEEALESNGPVAVSAEHFPVYFVHTSYFLRVFLGKLRDRVDEFFSFPV